MTFTVMIGNEALGKSHSCGKFESREAAEAFARGEAQSSRKFCIFEVWIGTPSNPIEPTGLKFRGEC